MHFDVYFEYERSVQLLMVIDIQSVRPHAGREVSDWEKNVMVRVLRKQGQIEPLQVRLIEPGIYETFKDDPWGAETLTAAISLGWKDILITEMRRYEQ